MTSMIGRKSCTLAMLGFLLSLDPALATSSCLKSQGKFDEAAAPRYQVWHEAGLGSHDRVCDTLDEVGDRYDDARDAFTDCVAGVTAVDRRGELRKLRIAKRANRCD